MAQASRNQKLIAAGIILVTFTILTLALALKGVIPSSAQTLFFVIEGDMFVNLVLFKLLADEKPQVVISTVRDHDRIGFCFTAKHKGLHHPRVMLNGVVQELHEIGVANQTPIEFMRVDRPYAFYPFRMRTSSREAGGC